jgi:flagellar hook-basal body complex protein FliE
MIEKINSQGNIQAMLQTLRSYQSQAAGGIDTDGNKVGGLNGLAGSQGPQGPAGFGDLVRQTVEQGERKPNECQQNFVCLRTRRRRAPHRCGVEYAEIVLEF